MNENELRNTLLEKIKNKINSRYKIDIEVPVPYKHIYLPTNDDPKLEIWCFKQDIVIYDTLYPKNVGYRDAKINFDSKFDGKNIQVVLEKDSSQNTHDIALPYIIIETKNKQPNTHDILTYSQKVQMIKTIFPYCRFIFLIFGTISPRTYRHGLYFDEIVTIKDVENKDEINNLISKIEKLIKEVKNDIQNIIK